MLDTHVLIRWLLDARKLSRMQLRTLESSTRRGQPMAISAISLLEIALLTSGERASLKISLRECFEDLNSNAVFRVLPLTYEVALEVASLGALRGPRNRGYRAGSPLWLVTSDQRIIESNLVPVVA